MSVKILYSTAFELASWPGEHVIQAIQTPRSFVMRWEVDGFAKQVLSFVNVNDCIRCAVRNELIAKERN